MYWQQFGVSGVEYFMFKNFQIKKKKISWRNTDVHFFKAFAWRLKRNYKNDLIIENEMPFWEFLLPTSMTVKYERFKRKLNTVTKMVPSRTKGEKTMRIKTPL